jgi:hypothetical protein
VNLCAPPSRYCVEPVVVTGEHAIINLSASDQAGDLMALASILVPYVGRQIPRYEALEPPRRTVFGIMRLGGVLEHAT